jgi:hypothetical protein
MLTGVFQHPNLRVFVPSCENFLIELYFDIIMVLIKYRKKMTIPV